LGAEPYRDFVGEYFLNWTTNPQFLTKMADAIPLIKTTAPRTSPFRLGTFNAQRNTRSVFIDDFEGTKRATSLGVVRESWSIASPPIDLVSSARLSERGLHDPAFIWFNPLSSFGMSRSTSVMRTGSPRKIAECMFSHGVASAELEDTSTREPTDMG
jgi:cell surface protein SprA